MMNSPSAFCVGSAVFSLFFFLNYLFCRYIYFPCSRRQFGLPGPSLLEIDHDERSENGTLASSLGVRYILACH